MSAVHGADDTNFYAIRIAFTHFLKVINYAFWLYILVLWLLSDKINDYLFVYWLNAKIEL